ncbi:MAG: M12 family metallopeptidase [Phycisphaerales bacterium]
MAIRNRRAAATALLALIPFFVALAPTLGQVPQAPPHPLWPEEADHSPLACEMLFPEGVEAGAWVANLWPNNQLFYAFDPAVSQLNRDQTRIALDEIATFANIDFIPRTDQPNYVLVRNGTGNSSFVGQVGGAQNLTMVSWSSRYVICHEFFHALGQWHHHQRPDSETYVVINYANIAPNQRYNFEVPQGVVADGEYNFSSIMHYGRCAFTICSCPSTCTAIDAAPGFEQFNSAMGNRAFMSEGDKSTLISRYGPAIDDTFEPNNTLETAPILTPGDHNLRLLDSNDYFTINSPQAGSLTVVCTAALWSTSNLTLSILSPDGTVLASETPVDAGGGNWAATATASVPAGPSIVRLNRVQPWGGSYTLNLTAPPPPPGGCPGDLNSDTVRNTADLTIFLANFGDAVPPGTQGDMDNNGTVNTADLTAFLSVFALPCP